MARLAQTHPQVFAGVNLSFGGIRHHLMAIQKHSKLRVELTPNEQAFPGFDNIPPHLREELIQYVPNQCLAIHSHVFPWMIHWGHNAQKNGIRWIHTYHLNYFPEHGKVGLEPWQEQINEALLHEAPQADIRLSVAKWQRDDLRNQNGIETYYLPNGVDVENCDLGCAERFVKKTQQNDFVLYVGRNDPVKNPAAFVQLAQQMPERSFVMLGQGLSAETMLSEFNQETPSNVSIYGATDHRGVQDAIAASAAVVVTSKREGLPTLVLEAMTHGKPIVVPEEAGCLEAIDNGRYGFVYEPDNILDLAQKTRDALVDTNRCTESRNRVLKEYDWRQVAKTLDIVYAEPSLSKVREILAEAQDN
ncbi:hypothetical protein GCM10007047_03850 [Cerasicoccus arenae]|uniref:Glycosyltransferase n=2 Tax=Cerasicoccus arenae TaxID=424488 RepID=A0A8J3DEX4_9BACT|nr:hypothetical protein GCM10007047_03850 [Cerasicoccus arenae]